MENKIILIIILIIIAIASVIIIIKISDIKNFLHRIKRKKSEVKAMCGRKNDSLENVNFNKNKAIFKKNKRRKKKELILENEELKNKISQLYFETSRVLIRFDIKIKTLDDIADFQGYMTELFRHMDQEIGLLQQSNKNLAEEKQELLEKLHVENDKNKNYKNNIDNLSKSVDDLKTKVKNDGNTILGLKNKINELNQIINNLKKPPKPSENWKVNIYEKAYILLQDVQKNLQEGEYNRNFADIVLARLVDCLHKIDSFMQYVNKEYIKHQED